jgi:histone arginine demethylase JMJD6
MKRFSSRLIISFHKNRYFSHQCRPNAFPIQVCYERYTIGEPCVIKNLITGWRARSRWQKDSFLENYGDGLFEFGRDAETGRYIAMTAREFLCRQEHVANPMYLFDKTFDLSCPSLLDDYRPPDIFQKSNIGKDRPIETSDEAESKWLLIGDVGTGSMLHVDPRGTSAWNALVIGRKEWIIISPGHGPCDETILDFVNTRDQDIKSKSVVDKHFDALLQLIENRLVAMKDRRIYHFIHEADDVVYVPCGWLHAVRNLEYTAAVTHNFHEARSCKV